MIYYRYLTNFDNIFFSMATKRIREDSNQAGSVLISNWPLGNRIRICNSRLWISASESMKDIYGSGTLLKLI
jgi:hypothetical protein